MIFLWIFLAIVFLILFILLVNVNLIIEYKEDLKLFARVLFIKLDLNRFSAKKEEAQKKEKPKEKEPTQKKTGSKKEKKNIFEFLSFVAELVKSVLKNFAKHAKIKLCYANISVGSDDAAKTAMLYGAVCQGVYYITELLTHFTHFKKNYKKINVVSDFVSEKIQCDFKLVITLKPLHLLLIGAKLIPIFIKKQNKERKEVTPNE